MSRNSGNVKSRYKAVTRKSPQGYHAIVYDSSSGKSLVEDKQVFASPVQAPREQMNY